VSAFPRLAAYRSRDPLVRRDQGDRPLAELLEASRAVVPFFEAMGVVQPVAPSLVPSAAGPLSRLLLTIPEYATEEPYARAYRSLLGLLPAHTRLVVLTHEAARDRVAGWLSARPADSTELLAAPDHLHFSVWAEDAYVVVRDGGSGDHYFVEPYSFLRYGDGLIADFVANATDLQHTQAPLYFQGGNCLVGDDFWLIGVDYPARTLQYLGNVLVGRPGEAPAQTVERVFREHLDPARRFLSVGSTVPVPAETLRLVEEDGEVRVDEVYLGNTPGTRQPLFHIDMFITLVGRGPDGRFRLLVGDPRRAAEVLRLGPWAYAMEPVFDSVASTLAARGFDVRRNPLPLASVDEVVPVEAFDDPGNPVSADIHRRLRQQGRSEVTLRSWYFATANNALVEDAGADRTVWLPTYGHGRHGHLRATDEANAALWRDLGFEVKLLGDFHAFALNLGAVHCIKKYLAR
jgi:hypothetical protein